MSAERIFADIAQTNSWTWGPLIYVRFTPESGHVHDAGAMSALPPKADMCGATRYVRFVPIADIALGAA